MPVQTTVPLGVEECLNNVTRWVCVLTVLQCMQWRSGEAEKPEVWINLDMIETSSRVLQLSRRARWVDWVDMQQDSETSIHWGEWSISAFSFRLACNIEPINRLKCLSQRKDIGCQVLCGGKHWLKILIALSLIGITRFQDWTGILKHTKSKLSLRPSRFPDPVKGVKLLASE